MMIIRIAAAVLLVLAIPLHAAAQCGQVSVFSCDASVGAALTADDCVTNDASVYDVWQFNGNEGDAVIVSLHATAFDPFLIVLDPSFVPVAASDDIVSGMTDAQIALTLTKSGTWTILANNTRGSASGDYALSFDTSACEAPRGPRRRAVRP